MKITKKSTLTGKVHTMEISITQQQIVNWESGELIQNVMPQLNNEEREFLISGITPEEWNEYFGNDEMEIITSHDCPPIPIRDYDWSASREDWDEGDLIGYGPTEQEAIDDLLEQEEFLK